MSQTIPGNLVSLDHLYSEFESVPNGQEAGENSEQVHVEPPTPKTCPVCKKNLPQNANLSFHIMLHPWTEKPYACDHCLFVTMTREELTEHCKEEHPSNRKYLCAVCGREYTNIRSLNKHKPIHALVMPFSCAYCDKGFPEYVRWRQHEISHKNARFECDICTIRFTTVKFYNEHREIGGCQTQVLECCQQVFPTRMDYVDHCYKHHRFFKKQEFPCEFCNRLYAFQCQLNIHKKNCSLRTNKPLHRSRPSVTMPPDPDYMPDAAIDIPATALKPLLIQTDGGVKRIYRCDICQKEFSTKFWLTKHRQKHTYPNVQNHVCSVCGLKYFSYSALYYHKKRIHLKCLPFKCTYCSKCFANNQGLQDHVTCHTGEQPYACIYCAKRFRNRSTKTEHQRIHTGERPYKCNFCDESFKRRSAKLSHERRHTGERPFKCRVCDLCFAQHSTMRSHEKRHQPPYSCNQCEQMFTCHETLVVHKKSHQVPHVEAHVEQEEVLEEIAWNQTGVATDADGNVYIQYQVA